MKLERENAKETIEKVLKLAKKKKPLSSYSTLLP